MNLSLKWLVVTSLLLGGACTRSSGDNKGASSPSPVSASADAGGAVTADTRDAGPPAEFVGVVHGVVKLADGAELPLAPMPTLQGQPPPSVAPCPPVDASDRRTIVRGPNGGLFPVHLGLTGMTAVPPHAPRMHELFIDACRLRPTLVGAMRGDTVHLTNRSEMALLPALPGESFVRGLLRGESRDFELKQTQTVVRCAFGSYCGESLIVATSHPLYAVTDAEGRFTIEQVPLGQELTLHAWHPLFQVASSPPFTLTSDHPEHTVELALAPAPAGPADAGVAKPRSAKGRKPPRGAAPAKPAEAPRGPAFQ